MSLTNRLAMLIAFLILFGSHPALAGMDEEIPSKAKVIALADGDQQIAIWNDDHSVSYAVRRTFAGAGHSWHVVADTSYELKLRYANFDPLVQTPVIPMHLRSVEQIEIADIEPGGKRAGTITQGLLAELLKLAGLPPAQPAELFIVQFLTQPLDIYRQEIVASGGTVLKYLPHHAYLVELDSQAKQIVEQMPFVRWVGPFQPAYKLDEMLLAKLLQGPQGLPPSRVNIMVTERGLPRKQRVADRIVASGGRIDGLAADGYRLEATLDGFQLLEIARMPDVWWIDPWSAQEVDMDLARELSGSIHLESIAGYSGQGVRGEIFDTNLFDSHIDFQTIPPLFHGPRSGSDDHGTATYGINFATGTGDPMGRGVIPSAQGIFADFGFLTNRYQHTAELLQSPYFAVFQSNSWGNTTTTNYTSISAELDDIIFLNDILLTQSQSNTGSILSRPQAWAKNIVSVGGINHENTLTTTDDFWGNASIGPAADGRVKPDLVHFYDLIWTTDDVQGGYRNFCCTSGATPIVAGHFGLLFQMWANGIFGNDVDTTATVFDNRCHAATAKALMINHARSYPFSGVSHNLTRTHQGWGLPDLARMFDMQSNTFVVDEDIVLSNLQTASFELFVADNTPEFRATLVYADLMGNVASNVHRINDLSLRVVSPTGTIYWGNNGLLSGNWSTESGVQNSIDTVENVFVQNPVSGTWQVEVIASEVNEDSHLETPEVDADFALVVSGVDIQSQQSIPPDSFEVIRGTVSAGKLSDVFDSDDSYLAFHPEVASHPSEPAVWVVFVGTSPSDAPAAFSVGIESSANTFGLIRTIEMFNFTSDEFDLVDSQSVPFDFEETIEIDISNNADDYIQPGTRRVQTRVGWRAASPVLLYPWTIRIDQLQWQFP